MTGVVIDAQSGDEVHERVVKINSNHFSQRLGGGLHA